MNVIISVNDANETLSVDLHVDMKPVLVNFVLDQMNFIIKNIRHCLRLNFFKKLLEKQGAQAPVIDLSSRSSEESSKEIKEFLSYTQASSVYYSKPGKRKGQSFKGESYALLLQFTLSKVEFVLHNCGPGLKCSKKFTVTFEDIIMSFNQRPNYYQFSLKVASGKGIYSEKLDLFNEYMKNENLGFHFRNHEDGEDDRSPSVVQVPTKWRSSRSGR